MRAQDIRLRSNCQYKSVICRGRSQANSLAVLYTLRREDEGPPRFGVSVPRRHGKAVSRNRVRRLFWEAYRSCREMMLPGYDLVLIPRKGSRGKGYREALAAMRDLGRRAGILREGLGA